jgi:hypothetical protein
MNVLRAMDLAGGQLSMQGIEILCRIRTNGKLYENGMILPSASSIPRCSRQVDCYASYVVLPKKGGQHICFHPPDVG